MKPLTASHLRWLLIGCAALALVPASASAQPTVTTSRFDYHPGNIVTIVGSGWASGDTVTLVISEEPANDPDVSVTVTADGDGDFLTEGFTVPDDAAGSSFTVTATNLRGDTAQVPFNDGGSPGALCADVAGHGAGVCPGATGATGVLGADVNGNRTHYAQPAGSTATYEIINATDAVAEAATASFCPGGVKVLDKSSDFGNTILCGSLNGSTITFQWTALSSTGGPACSTTIVAYKVGTTPGGDDDFSNTSNDIVADDLADGSPEASAGIGVVDASGSVIPCQPPTTTTTSTTSTTTTSTTATPTTSTSSTTATTTSTTTSTSAAPTTTTTTTSTTATTTSTTTTSTTARQTTTTSATTTTSTTARATTTTSTTKRPTTTTSTTTSTTSSSSTTTMCPCSPQPSSIGSNFNGTPIAQGNFIWFNAVLNASGLGSHPVTIRFDNSKITFAASGVNYTLPVPSAKIVFDPAATTATTVFNTATNTWETTAPSGLAGSTFLDGLVFPVPPGGLPGGINPVTWSGTVSSDTSGVAMSWKWAAAVYTTFSTDNNALGVKPVDDGKASAYKNADHAGTPEKFKSFAVGGARGGGSGNFTGSYSGTISVQCQCGR